MKKTLIIAACIGCFLVLGLVANTPGAAAASQEAAWDKVLEGAKKEGMVMIYGKVDPKIRKEISQAFTDKYGIKLELLYIGRGSRMAARLKKERSAGVYLADLAVGGMSSLTLLLKPAGILDPMDPALILPEVTDSKAWRSDFNFADKDRTAKYIRSRFSRFIVRNTNLVKDGEIKTYRDLLNPKWKGKIVMGDPTSPGSGLGMMGLLNDVWGFEKTEQFLRELVKQEPVVVKEAGFAEEWLGRGKYALAVGTETENFPELVKLGMPVTLVTTVEGGQLGPGAGCIGVVNKGPHPNAAAVFLNWLFSKEGMTLWSKVDGLPAARLDVPTDHVDPMFIPKPGERIFVETEESLKMRRKLANMSKEALAPVMKHLKKKKK